MLASTSSPVEFIYNTKLTDKDKAMDAAAAYGWMQGWQLMAVIWDHEDATGHHFKIIYNPQ